jgi:hypothetical protein
MCRSSYLAARSLPRTPPLPIRLPGASARLKARPPAATPLPNPQTRTELAYRLDAFLFYIQLLRRSWYMGILPASSIDWGCRSGAQGTTTAVTRRCAWAREPSVICPSTRSDEEFERGRDDDEVEDDRAGGGPTAAGAHDTESSSRMTMLQLTWIRTPHVSRDWSVGATLPGRQGTRTGTT